MARDKLSRENRNWVPPEKREPLQQNRGIDDKKRKGHKKKRQQRERERSVTTTKREISDNKGREREMSDNREREMSYSRRKCITTKKNKWQENIYIFNMSLTKQT